MSQTNLKDSYVVEWVPDCIDGGSFLKGSSLEG